MKTTAKGCMVWIALQALPINRLRLMTHTQSKPAGRGYHPTKHYEDTRRVPILYKRGPRPVYDRRYTPLATRAAESSPGLAELHPRARNACWTRPTKVGHWTAINSGPVSTQKQCSLSSQDVVHGCVVPKKLSPHVCVEDDGRRLLQRIPRGQAATVLAEADEALSFPCSVSRPALETGYVCT